MSLPGTLWNSDISNYECSPPSLDIQPDDDMMQTVRAPSMP